MIEEGTGHYKGNPAIEKGIGLSAYNVRKY
jgi:hypothetical protein